LWAISSKASVVEPVSQNAVGTAQQICTAPDSIVTLTKGYPLGGALNEDDSFFDDRDEVYAKVSLSASHADVDPRTWDILLDSLQTNTVKGYS
jgi:hypothetical protein